MKEFDLEKAKSGAKVCTRDGKPARIISFDKEDETYPIIALVKGYDPDGEALMGYTNEGLFGVDTVSPEDLMLAGERHEGWINLYRILSATTEAGRIVYDTQEAAESDAVRFKDFFVATIKIEWEE